MGREIRRVPPHWQHPKKKRFDLLTQREVEDYQPMYDSPFGAKMREWYEQWQAWERGERDKYSEGETMPFWEWDGPPPDPEYHRPDWPDGSATWFQMYETVSEGTPVSPPFATTDELIAYLVENGDFWDQLRGTGGWEQEEARQFVELGFAMSLVIQGGEIYEPRDGMPPP